jgi:polygalacturonase
VRIANCDIESDDDALCLKASFSLGVRGATEDVVVTNCRLRSPSNCFKLGTESTGDFRQIVLSNCVFDGTAPADRDASAAAEGGGIALLTVDGGTIDGVTISNVVMRESSRRSSCASATADAISGGPCRDGFATS